MEDQEQNLENQNQDGEGPPPQQPPEQQPPEQKPPEQKKSEEAPAANFDEASAIIDEVTDQLKTLTSTDRFKFLTEKFAAKFPDEIDGLNSAIKSIVDGFAKSLEIKAG